MVLFNMNFMFSTSVLIVEIAVISLKFCDAQSTCSNGWFGDNCQFMCHCDLGPCDKVTGTCNSGCQSDWFGPGCQYFRMGFSVTGGPELNWLTDVDDETCNDGSMANLTIALDTPIPLTWVRLVVTNTAYLDQIELGYQTVDFQETRACPNPQSSRVNDNTVDILCLTLDKVSQVKLAGPGVRWLCSLYISGGRNVAIKQNARQSSRFQAFSDNWRAIYAVDGRLPTDTPSHQTTCTHTDPGTTPDWWEVTFSQAVLVTWFRIHNREDCCMERLVDFRLTASPLSSSDSTYNYIDPQNIGQSIYFVVPSPKVDYPIKNVRITEGNPSSNILSLCEVFVFGEANCPAGWFGRSCERQCNCAEQTSCFVHSGGCPTGCAPGYIGEDCSDCPVGRYGPGCSEVCSSTCGGDYNMCDIMTGECTQGCNPGYTGTFCQKECPIRKYGPGCALSCNTECGGFENACDHINGTCSYGCDEGYRGDMCEDKCPIGTYGLACSKTCNAQCRGLDDKCDHITGKCEYGCDIGYRGDKCDSVCSVGSYDLACAKLCNTNCKGSDNACNHINGSCTNGCDAGYDGQMCQTRCRPGTFGAGCAETCSVHCAGVGDPCHHETGKCDLGCDAGYWYDRCTQECLSGTYGDMCRGTCDEKCGGPDDACHHVSGRCLTCDPGLFGDMCSYSCSSNCYGAERTCNRTTGACDRCASGRTGAKCEDNCARGFYGPRCNQTCSEHCEGVTGDCDRVTGACANGCEPGFQGLLCRDKCPATKWGKDCKESCISQCVDTGCDHVTGVCNVCSPGYWGLLCNQTMPRLQQGTPTGSDSSNSNAWAIAMTVVVGVFVVAAFAIFGLFLWRRHRVSNKKTDKPCAERNVYCTTPDDIPLSNQDGQPAGQQGNLDNFAFESTYDSPLDTRQKPERPGHKADELN